MRTSYKGKKKAKYGFERNQLIMLLISLSLIIGAFIGAVMANTIDINEYNQLSKFMGNFINDFNILNLNKSEIFYECMVKYGKTALIIWFLGFIPMGIIVIFIIVFAKGLSYGFTTAFIIRSFGTKGILYILALYVPQNIILIPVYFLIAFTGLKYIFREMDNNKTSSKNSVIELKSYFVAIMIAGVFIILASLTDVFITPILINSININ